MSSRRVTPWVRGPAALLFVLFAVGAVPWCCLLPGSHHAHPVAVTPDRAHRAHAAAGHADGAAYAPPATLCSSGTGSPQLKERPGAILSWVHLGWVFQLETQGFALLDRVTADARAAVGWRAAPSPPTGPDVPPPRSV